MSSHSPPSAPPDRKLDSRPSAPSDGILSTIERSRWATVVCAVLFALNASQSPADSPFIRPGEGIPSDRPVWGHRDGIQIGLAPTPGPHGLIRVFAPHVGVPYPSRVNYLSIEPTTGLHRARDQSELAISRHRNGRRGLHFLASDSRDQPQANEEPARGRLSKDGRTLRVFIHTEKFPGGAMPIIEVVFYTDHPNEVEFRTHQSPEGETMTECVLSATMGNYALLRTLRLPSGKTHQVSEMWRDNDAQDHLGFLPWRDWPIQRIDDSTELKVSLFPELSLTTNYSPRIPGRWRYAGTPSVQSWIVDPNLQTYFAVNARETYWGIDVPIPNGRSIENFEVRRPFVEGQSLRFRIDSIESASNTSNERHAKP